MEAAKYDEISYGKRILLVDDSLTSIKSLAKTLRHAGMLPIECSDGGSAVFLAEQHHVDLIMLDLMMPNVDGLHVLREIRAKDNMKFLPVVMMTAHKDENTLVQAFEAGADDYITKPFDVPVLLARLRTHLRGWQLWQELEQANQNIKQAREQEMNSARWRAAVEMAGATAHKLNQPLTTIVCYADILLKKLNPNDEDYKAIKSISDESERMAMILRKMAELTKVRTSEYVGGTTIVDLDRSFEKTNPGIMIDQIRDPNKDSKK